MLIFSHTELEYADLRGANLTNTNFSGAKMVHAKLIGANLTNTNFSGAILRNTSMERTIYYKEPTLNNIELVKCDNELTDTEKQKIIKSKFDPKLWKLIVRSNSKYNFRQKKKKKK